MKRAIVCDWLTNFGGAEQVILAMHELYPDAPIYTSVFNPEGVPQFAKLDVRTSFLQKWPFAKTKHKLYPAFRPFAFESLDLREYDVVISSASAEAKGIITKPDTVHICYCHTPTRYYWSDYHAYLHRLEFGILNPIVRKLMPRMIHNLRQWDYVAAQRVDYFIANSVNTQKRIKKYYDRESTVMYPFTDTTKYIPGTEKKEEYFAVISRLIPYKHVDLAVEACTRLNLPLKVIGSGPELDHLKEIAGSSVEFLGFTDEQTKLGVLQKAKGFIFSADEDFGIVPLEAMACGTPVIAYGKGGALETVVEGKTGVFFHEQTSESLVATLKKFDSFSFNTQDLVGRAKQFDISVFKKTLDAFVEKAYHDFQR
jgi:glycosyltransferase involved in cell wall biosynthesis